MRIGIVKIVSHLMLVIFLAGIAPKEYLHDLLYDHHDTIHHELKKGDLVISGKHTHCSFLGFVFAPFVATEKQFLSFREISVFSGYSAAPYHFLFCGTVETQPARGPPAYA